MTRRLPAAIAALTTIAAPVVAQETYALDPIIVSGGLTPIAEARYGRASTVITSDELEERGILSVQEALRSVPGVSVAGTGQNFTQIRLRGAEADHTLILIDGIEAAGGDSEYILTGLETANIDRIEVLRGPQSVYYGSNASAGVINIITRRARPGLHYGGRAEAGGGWAASGFVSYRDDRGGLTFGIARRQDEGWDYSGSDGEKDGIDRLTLNLSGDFRVLPALTLGFVYRSSDERSESDTTDGTATTAQGYVVDDTSLFSDRDERVMQVYADTTLAGGRLSGRLSWEHTDLAQSYNGFAPTDTDSESVKARLTYGLDGTVEEAAHLLSVLVERTEDSSDLNPLYARENRSAAAEYRGSFAGGLDVQLGARFDDNTVFGDSWTWTAAAAYTFANGIRLHGSAGTGVVNPTYFELYAAAFGYSGNPNLDPERNRSFDLGIEAPFAGGRGLIDVTYFNETLKDEIVAIATGPGTFSYTNQSGDSDRQGIEVSGQFDATADLTLRAGYTWLDATDPGGAPELRRPEHTLDLGATWRTLGGRGTISADARYVAGAYDTQFYGSFATAELPDYWTVDLAASYRVDDHLRLNARVENLFDAEYSDTWGYASRGRTLYLGASSEW